MSFSADLKRELAKQTGKARHCQIAELSAMLMFPSLSAEAAEGDRYRIRFRTEHSFVAEKYYLLLKKLFDIHPQLTVDPGSAKKNPYAYTVLTEKPEEVRRILQAARIMDDSGAVPDEIPILHQPTVQKECCRRAFLRGAFLMAGSVNDPNRSYHFEIACATRWQAEQLCGLVSGMGIRGRIVQRKKSWIMYVKESDQISDLLGYMGSRIALMNFENVRILRGVRGDVNRKVNCETANLRKTVTASMRQVQDIEYIQNTIGLSELSNGLDEVARIRLEYPEASLKEIGSLLNPPVGKSGVNHRLRKLSIIADKLREENKEEKFDGPE